jgi:hypothetical protein
VVTIPRVAEMFKSGIDEMTYGTNVKLINLFDMENANLTHEDLDTSIDEVDNRWNIDLGSYDTISSRVKLSSNGQLSHSSWSSGIFGESHWHMTKNSVGWPITMNPRIVFKL